MVLPYHIISGTIARNCQILYSGAKDRWGLGVMWFQPLVDGRREPPQFSSLDSIHYQGFSYS